ncbi:MAG: RpiB/LacA/LacB family sugar-phosphate isomerase [Candidatus Paceibacterota bacterium]
MKKDIKIHVATDHAGFELKEAVKEHLDAAGYVVVDHGASNFRKEDDYPDFIHPAAQAVRNEGDSVGIIFGHSGQGEAMVANRYPGVRAAVYYGSEPEIISLSRQHNDANVLSIAAGFVSEPDAIEAIDRWLDTEFSDETRHQRRINKIDDNQQYAE